MSEGKFEFVINGKQKVVNYMHIDISSFICVEPKTNNIQNYVVPKCKTY